MKELFEYLQSHQLTLSTCESLTGGLFASEFVALKGASKVFLGGVIAYQDNIKINVMGIDANLINTEGAVSSACAESMARQACHLFASDVSISFTGNAGPDGSEGKPVGLVYVGLTFKGITTSVALNYKDEQRNDLRMHVVEDGARLLLEYIKKEIIRRTDRGGKNG